MNRYEDGSGGAVFGRDGVALVTAAQAAEQDRLAREQADVPERVLMENAGRSAALVLDRLWPRGRVVAVVGSGHNGGDAVVLLRNLRAWGREVAMLPVGSSLPVAGLRHGFDLPLLDAADADTAFRRADILVDGILGTGARGAPRPPADRLITAMNESGRPILAIDLPSGVDATTGQVEGVAIDAAVTVTFGWPKLGLLFQPARQHCGRLLAVEIGFPPHTAPAAEVLTPGWAATRLPARPPDAHKTLVGRLLVVAGTEGMAGAAALAVEGAYRAGAGLIRVASHAANRTILQTLAPGATFVDRLRPEDADPASMHALLIGPGLGTGEEVSTILHHALQVMAGRPTLIDADGLNTLAEEPGALEAIGAERDLVITPHPREMSRITGVPMKEILADPVGQARAAAERFGCSVLLKGMPSVVAAPGQPLLVNSVGSSDVATAGMGDALAGVIGAFLAGGVRAREAAGLGLFYCSRAAEIAGRGRSLEPWDVCQAMDRAFGDPGEKESTLRLPFVTFDQPPRR